MIKTHIFYTIESIFSRLKHLKNYENGVDFYNNVNIKLNLYNLL